MPSGKEYHKAYYQKNRKRILERQKAYNAERKEQKAAYDKERYKTHWKEKALYNLEYYRRKKA